MVDGDGKKRDMHQKKKSTIHPYYTKTTHPPITNATIPSNKKSIRFSLTIPEDREKLPSTQPFHPNLTPKTLTGEPQNYMFAEMRSALAIDKSIDILDHIYALPTAAEQEAAHAKIQAVERRAMELQVPQPGLVTLMEYLDKKGVKKGICTRNFE